MGIATGKKRVIVTHPRAHVGFKDIFVCHKPLTDLCVYRRDPILCAMDNLNIRNAALIFCIYLIPLLLVKIFIACYSHTALSADGIRIFLDDLNRFPPFAVAVHLFRGKISIPTKSPTEIPYLRDYSDLIILSLMAAHMALVHRQWRNIGTAPRELHKSTVLSPRAVSVSRLNAAITKYDRLFNSRLLIGISFGCAVILVAAFYLSVARYGIYSGLNIPYSRVWSQQAYVQWCENPKIHPVLFSYSTVVSVFIVFYMLRHNFVGILAVALCRHILGSRSNSDKALLQIIPEHYDGIGGLRLLKEIMYLVYVSILIMGVALLMLYYRLGAHTAFLLMPFGAIFFLLNPFYICLPLYYISRHITACKSSLLSRLEQQRMMAMKSRSAAEIVLCNTQIRSVASVPDYLFTVRELLSIVFTYMLPLILFIDWAVRSGLQFWPAQR